MADAKKKEEKKDDKIERDPVGALNDLLEAARKKENAGDAAGALSLLDAAAKPLRVFGTYHYARGALLFRRGDLAKAIEGFREAVRLEPEIGEFQANLGAALVETARKTKAQPALEEALAVLEAAATHGGGKTTLVYNNLGMAYQTAGRLDEALDAFDAALGRDPQDLAALYNRAATLHMLGREEECLAALDKTLAVNPKFEPAIQSRRSTLARLGRR